jgi:Kelch motif protein
MLAVGCALAIVGIGAYVLAGGLTSGHPGARTNTVRVRPRPGSTPSSLPPAVAPSQRNEASLPVAIQEAAAAATPSRLYVAGGYDTGRNSSSAVFVFNGSTWANGPALPIAMNHPGAAAIGDDVYVAGGFNSGSATNRVFVLSHGAATWRELAPMKRPRGALALLGIGGRLYAVGGLDGTTQVAFPEVYDPTKATWSDLPSMPHPRNHVGGYVNGSLACVAGGREPSTNATIDCFDTTTLTWRSPILIPTATSGAAAVVLNGLTVVAGGEPSNETTVFGDVQERRAGAWTTQPMLTPRHGTGFAIFEHRLWMCGGATAPGFHAVSTCTSMTA